MLIDVEVHDGGSLDLGLGPQIVAAGADLEVTTAVSLAAGSRLRCRDELVLGREGEGPGSVLQRFRVTRAGAPLVATDLALGPRWPASGGPGGIDGARTVASLLCVGEGAPPARAVEGARGAILEAAPHAWMGVVLAARTAPARAWLDHLEAPCTGVTTAI